MQLSLLLARFGFGLVRLGWKRRDSEEGRGIGKLKRPAR